MELVYPYLLREKERDCVSVCGWVMTIKLTWTVTSLKRSFRYANRTGATGGHRGDYHCPWTWPWTSEDHRHLQVIVMIIITMCIWRLLSCLSFSFPALATERTIIREHGPCSLMALTQQQASLRLLSRMFNRLLVVSHLFTNSERGSCDWKKWRRLVSIS